MAISAIPTTYAGVNFRSRLEAKWACWFDLMRWKWEYEPIDLNGYIPDFLLRFQKPIYVEVKGVITDSEMLPHVNRISKLKRDRDILFVGSGSLQLHQSVSEDIPERLQNPMLGLILPAYSGESRWHFFSECTGHGSLFVQSFEGRDPRCAVCGDKDGYNYDSDKHMFVPFLKKWNRACNKVQWKPNKGRKAA